MLADLMKEGLGDHILLLRLYQACAAAHRQTPVVMLLTVEDTEKNDTSFAVVIGEKWQRFFVRVHVHFSNAREAFC
jgi:hypothetical protein